MESGDWRRALRTGKVWGWKTNQDQNLMGTSMRIKPKDKAELGLCSAVEVIH